MKRTLLFALLLTAGCGLDRARTSDLVLAVTHQQADAYPRLIPDLLDAGDAWHEAGFPYRVRVEIDGNSPDSAAIEPGRTVECDVPRIGCTYVGTFTQIALASDNYSAALVLHEVGHAIGLVHLADKHAVMYPKSGAKSIGTADRAAVAELYSLSAD